MSYWCTVDIDFATVDEKCLKLVAIVDSSLYPASDLRRGFDGVCRFRRVREPACRELFA